jgi:hypothetical protein
VLRGIGDECDPQGFDQCEPGGVCAPGVSAQKYTCKSGSELRRAACAAAQRLNPFAGQTSVTGTVKGISLWNPPAGCISESARATSDAVVALYLSRAAKSLTLTTDSSKTNFDTVLYLLKGCADDAATSLACNDDLPGPASTLNFSNLPAGDYRVVIDSLTPGGGTYLLSANAR